MKQKILAFIYQLDQEHVIEKFSCKNKAIYSWRVQQHIKYQVWTNVEISLIWLEKVLVFLLNFYFGLTFVWRSSVTTCEYKPASRASFYFFFISNGRFCEILSFLQCKNSYLGKVLLIWSKRQNYLINGSPFYFTIILFNKINAFL